MNEKIGLINKFRNKVLKLIDDYPNFEDEITDSSEVVYLNWKPSLSISPNIDNKELINTIQAIYTSVFN